MPLFGEDTDVIWPTAHHNPYYIPHLSQPMTYTVEQYSVSNSSNLKSILQYESNLKEKDGWKVVSVSPLNKDGVTTGLLVLYQK